MENTVVISEQSFTIPSKFAEGHVLNAAEARALTAYRAELIGHGFRKSVKEAVTAGTFDAAKTQAEINERAASYEFGAVGGRRLDPVEKEARDIATASVRAALEKKGVSFAAYKKEKAEHLAKLIDDFAARADVVEKAKKVVAARAKNAIDVGEFDL
jgi:hypothetical protein